VGKAAATRSSEQRAKRLIKNRLSSAGTVKVIVHVVKVIATRSQVIGHPSAEVIGHPSV
jgi:hypothetical protein